MINQSDLMNINLGAPTVTSPQPAGPGGNPIVPTPASPSEWPKMLIAIAILSGGVWAISTFGNDQAGLWAAVLVLLAMVTYYETHNNKQFSEGVKNLLGSIK